MGKNERNDEGGRGGRGERASKKELRGAGKQAREPGHGSGHRSSSLEARPGIHRSTHGPWSASELPGQGLKIPAVVCVSARGTASVGGQMHWGHGGHSATAAASRGPRRLASLWVGSGGNGLPEGPAQGRGSSEP